MTHPYPSLLRYCLSKVVSTSASEHRTDVRTTVPAVQVLGKDGKEFFKTLRQILVAK